MADFAIADLNVGGGRLGICPLPQPQDMVAILGWGPGVVLCMVSVPELPDWWPRALAGQGIGWRHLPITDFGAPGAQTAALWPEASASARKVLGAGGKVLVHCRGGCGRSGMAFLRLMIEAGEKADGALARLRAARPCAVETAAQLAWAKAGRPC